MAVDAVGAAGEGVTCVPVVLLLRWGVGDDLHTHTHTHTQERGGSYNGVGWSPRSCLFLKDEVAIMNA